MKAERPWACLAKLSLKATTPKNALTKSQIHFTAGMLCHGDYSPPASQLQARMQLAHGDPSMLLVLGQGTRLLVQLAQPPVASILDALA